MAIETAVLVVGAGPSGLATAIELGSRGLPVLVVERNERSGTAPRAKTTNVRTRTLLRRWGIADQLAAEAPFGVDYPNNMVFVTRLAGQELARFSNAFNASPERSQFYPEHGQWIPQYTLERIMLEKLRTLPSVEVRFNTRFESAQQDESGVYAVISDANGIEQVSAQYLVGADGARSQIRDLIGAKMEGTRGIAHAYNIIFRAPELMHAHKHGPAAIYWQISPDGFSAIGPMDRNDTWFFAPAGVPEGKEISPDDAIAMIRKHTGFNVPIEILSADQWVANDLLADFYSKGRIFLAGDACHLHPPAGGYGMNMGVGDGLDLGWKIAAVLSGWGGTKLLESYERERRPVHRHVIDEAIANFASYLAAIPAEIEEDSAGGEVARRNLGAAIAASKGREFNTLGTVLGLSIENSGLIVSEPGEQPVHDSQVYMPSARPGNLAPHAWLHDGRSLYDLFGHDFSLLITDECADPEAKAAAAQAEALGVPLKVVKVTDMNLAATYSARLVLIRPDQHVAWRGHNWNASILPQAVGRS